MTAASGEALAWGWVAHLRSGGTTPWSGWSVPAPDDEQAGRYLPGAQQLELLRRLNLRGGVGPALAERVLSASAPGRGLPDLGLVGVLPESAFGPEPVDPSELHAAELTRVATSLIAEDVVAADEPATRARRTRLLRHRYRVVGDPELARPLREALTAQGRPPGGRSPTVVVLGADVESMLAHAWSVRCFTTGAAPWPEWISAQVRRGGLPPRIDLAALAQEWSARVGAGRVHVALDPAEVPKLLHSRRARPRAAAPSADASELARRCAPVVGTLVTPERRAHLMWLRLRPWLAKAPGSAVRVPERHRGWLERQATDQSERLARGDYAVHGRLAAAADRPSGTVPSVGETGPDDERVLALALRLLLDGPAGVGADPGEGM
jgi:hypothetical protein